MVMVVQGLSFDLSRPCGLIDADADELECVHTCNQKSVEFTGKCKSVGYDCLVHVSPLSGNVCFPHIMSFRLSGLKQEYGWNAVRICVGELDAPMYKFDSQWFALDDTCVITLCLWDFQLDFYVEKDNDEPPIWLGKLEEWTRFETNTGMLLYSSFPLQPGDLPKDVPSISLAMMVGNRAEIIAPWKTRAYAAHQALRGLTATDDAAGCVYA